MAADKLAFDYNAMERRPGDMIQAEDWNKAMRAIANLVEAVGSAAVPATTPAARAELDWARSSPLAPSPARVGSITIGQGLRAVAIDVAFAYVSCLHSFQVFDLFRYDRLQVFDDPAVSLHLATSLPPAPRGQVTCPDAEDIFLAGGYAYVAAGSEGLAIVNIGDPRQPRVESILPLSGSVRRACVVGDIAYVVSYEQGLQIVNVADKQRPILLSQIFVELPNAVVVRDNCAFVASDDSGFCIVDVSSPASPAYHYRYATEFSSGKDICLHGALAYICDGENRVVRIIDVSQPATPHTTNTFAADPIYMPARMLVRGDSLLIASDFPGGQGLYVYDISQTTAPLYVASVGSSTRGMAANERYAYLTTAAGSLEVFDLRPPKLALPTGSVGIGTANPQARLEVQGGRTILEQEPWHAAELSEGLQEFGTGWNPVQYFKDSQGVVHLRGMLEASTNAKVETQVLFILPEGYRPEFNESHLVCASASGMASKADMVCWVYIYPNGAVFIGSTDHKSVSLDGITFRAFT